MARALKTGSGQPGNTIPLSGGLIQADSSDGDLLTIQGHSSQAGDLLNISTYKASSTDDSGEVVNVDKDGFMRIHKKAYAMVTTASTTATVSATDSGKEFLVLPNAQGMAVTLPTVAAGLNYKWTLLAACGSNGFSINSGSSNIYGVASTGGIKAVAATVADAIGGAWYSVLGSSLGWHLSWGAHSTVGLVTVSS